MKSQVSNLNNRGLATFALPPRSKKATLAGWSSRTTQDNNPNEFNEDSNVAVVLGKASGNIVDIDLDNAVARSLAARFLPETGWKFGRQSERGAHWQYCVADDPGSTVRLDSKSFKGERIVEYLANGSYCVFPPSLHQDTGEQIEFESFTEAGRVTREQLLESVFWLATATVLCANYQEGKRQDIVMAFTGYMLVLGMAVDDILRVVEAVCDYANDGERAQRIDAVHRTVEKFQGAQPFTQAARLEELIGADAVGDIKKYRDKLLPKASGGGRQIGPRDRMRPTTPSNDLTDAGVGAMFAADSSDKIMWIEEEGCLYAYEGSRWHRDKDAVVTADIFNRFVIDKQQEVAAIPNAMEAQILSKGWTKYRGHKPAQHAIAQARSGLRRSSKVFDQDDAVFACRNGVINLRSGEFRPHSPKNYITVHSNVAYEPDADCPLFKAFLITTFGGDQELCDYMKGILGYWLTGFNNRKEFYVFFGPLGDNGKSTLVNIVSHVLGPLAMSMMPDTLFEQKSQSAAMADIYTLRGTRLAIAQEAESETPINASLIKAITGGDPVKAKGLYNNPIETTPNYKVVMVANKRPNLNVYDVALRRRVKFIPFDHVIAAKDKDLNLGKKLEAEASGILNFLMEGARLYFANAIVEPASVREATDKQVFENDSVAGFLSEMTVKDVDGSIECPAMWHAYQTYCEEYAVFAVSRGEFSRVLKGRGISDGRNAKTRFWRGIRLTDWQEKDREIRESAGQLSRLQF